ncbi:hypothetical protein N898_12940 [Salmonella enterica subsp. arizonae serovar 62:z36:- str. RKS2983]|nr:hypothetical protein N898_12940 [Salmonella enterica subsp. arizonae serovar 62:z36:- str. RKS2983]
MPAAVVVVFKLLSLRERGADDVAQLIVVMFQGAL